MLTGTLRSLIYEVFFKKNYLKKNNKFFSIFIFLIKIMLKL